MSNNYSATRFIESLFPYGDIWRDDYRAAEKLENKLKALQDKQQMFKAINNIVRKKVSPSEKVDLIVKLDNRITVPTAIGLLSPDFMGRIGIPDYMLKNNNGNIKAVRDRIGKVQQVESMAVVDETRNGIRIWIDKDENRIFIDFGKKPDSEVIDLIKSCGFRWRPSESLWSGNIDAYRLKMAKRVWDMTSQEA